MWILVKEDAVPGVPGVVARGVAVTCGVAHQDRVDGAGRGVTPPASTHGGRVVEAGGVVELEVAVHLVGGDLMEARHAVAAAGVEEGLHAEDVGL